MHLVCRIANALLALRNAGHAQYITWSYSFHCEFELYSELDNQAVKMEYELKQWNAEIEEFRNNFRVLNLFTTQQLRVIRQQLGQLSCERILTLPPTVLSMLMSISPQICEKDIKESLQSVKSKSSLVGFHSSSKPEDLDGSSCPVENENDDKLPMNQINPEDEVSVEAAIEKLLMQLIDRLSDIERDAYEDLKDAYSDNIAYLGVKNCANDSNQQGKLVELANTWCLENRDHYKNKDTEVMLNELQAFNKQNNEPTTENSNENAQNTQCENDVNIIESQNNNVNEVEQMLIESGVPSGLAREAAKRHPDDIEKALSYSLDEQNRLSDQSFLQLASASIGSR